MKGKGYMYIFYYNFLLGKSEKCAFVLTDTPNLQVLVHSDLNQIRLRTSGFKYCFKFLIRFRSRLWQGHSARWICFDVNPFTFRLFRVCEGNLRPSHTFFVAFNNFSSRNSLYLLSSNHLPISYKKNPIDIVNYAINRNIKSNNENT